MTTLSQQELPASHNSPLRVLIAEDSAMGCQLLQDGLKRARLGQWKIYCATSTEQVLEQCRQHAVEIALISEDLQYGAAEGLKIIDVLRRTHPGIRCVLLVRKLRRELTLDAFRNGAKGVFCRTEPIKMLAKCILAVRKGQIWVDSEQLELILQALVESKPMRAMNFKGAPLLTKREDQVAAMVSEGLTNREVALRLGLSEHTVSNYLFKIYDKLGISSRVEFVLYVCGWKQQGLANADPILSRTTNNAQLSP
jgi:two-component system, NarL family, nitrate/nitrite response regulator NarL